MASAGASVTRNPVEKRIALLRDLWLEHSEDPALRIVVWRIPDNAERMMEAFFATQQQAGELSTPDVFMRFDAPFETGFGYSRALADTLRDTHAQSADALRQQGVDTGWQPPPEAQWATAAGFLSLAASFAAHYGLHRFAAVLQPQPVASAQALTAWLDEAARAPLTGDAANRVRLVLVDDATTRRWQPLVETHGAAVRMIEAPIDMFEAASETAAQTGGSGPTVMYRQMLADVMRLLSCGSAEDTVARAQRALVLAEKQGWQDQQSVLHMMMAGAWMKARRFTEAVQRYRVARDIAATPLPAADPRGAVAASLSMQSWFGEAGAWIAANDLAQAAHAYEQGALDAARVPNALFVVEGYRMAAHCLFQAGQRDAAQHKALAGLRTAREMPAADRAQTTVPQLLHDMLAMQDTRRAEKIADCAQDYQRAIDKAVADAEAGGAKLGETPAQASLDRIEQTLLDRYERSFQSFLQARERLVAGASEPFRTTVAIGREWLHPAWSGVPDVKHPLDKDMPHWSQAPDFCVLPDPAPFLAVA